MATSSSRNKSNGHSFFSGRSSSPTGRFCSASSAFSARPGPMISRSTSPTHLNLYRSVSPSSSIRFSSISVSPRHHKPSNPPPFSTPGHHHHHHHHHHQKKQTCACSPSTHPGSFRCRLHKNQNQNRASSNNNSQLNMRRSAMTNSLVRIGTVEGELLKRALASLIRPSSHHLRRRGDFQPRPTRLSIMTMAPNPNPTPN